MKKKPIVIIILLLFVCLAYCYLKYVYGWMEFRKNTDTPKEFLSHTLIKKESYLKDSTDVLRRLKYMLHNHEQSFYLKDYFDSTQLNIDSILYSPDFNKLAVFVITKNPTYRQLMPDKKYDWYYDGYCYLGLREKDTIDLTSITGGYRNSYDKEDLASSLREYYFRFFAAINDTSEVSRYKYNLDDTRFWSGPIWKEIDDEKLKKQEFEEEKKNHPENVYEPKQ